ncbi:MAG: Wzz/FepE/Etk N-terminal domain-containing protein [Armatimonadetes bacterium]|nr:Wzz/FepE/Etk N-terminal domain-containing protein [Armatimonadota bacterium]
METTQSHTTDELDPIGFLVPLMGKWKLLSLATVIGALAGFLISQLMPRVYQSRATIYAMQSGGASSLLRSLPVPLGAIGTSGTTASYYAALLESETMFRNVIARLKLTHIREFAGEKPDIEEALRRLKKRVDVKEKRDGTVEIMIRCQSPYLAARIGNTMLDCLDGMVVTSARRKVAFISARLEETMRDLRKAEDDMRRFQEENDIALVDEQTRALISELSELDGRLLALDVELEEVSSRLTNSGDLESLIDDEVRKRAIESSRNYVLARRAALQEKLTRIPHVAVEYARLQRRIAVLNKTFEILTEQYQLQRITQQGEDGDYQIIDRARPNTRKVSPRTAVNTVLGGALAFTLTALGVTAFAPVRKYRKG